MAKAETLKRVGSPVFTGLQLVPPSVLLEMPLKLKSLPEIDPAA
jgi:hypothetical protein